MRKIETPTPIQDVIHRRLRLATPETILGAFGVPKVVISVYQDDDLWVVAVGSNAYQARLDSDNLRFGSPTPWIRLRGKEETRALIVDPPGRSARNVTFENIHVAGTKTLVSIAPGSMHFYHGGKVRTVDAEFVLGTLFVVGREESLIWLEVATQFEFHLVKTLSPHIRRLKNAY